MSDLLCNNCYNSFKSPNKLNYSPSCTPNVHIFCDGCVNKFKSARHIPCKTCNKRHPLKILQLASSPWDPIDPIDIIGEAPSQLINQIQKCIKWWEQQSNMKVNRYKMFALNSQKKLKLEREKYQSESLKYRNEINNLTKKK
eukprot:77065_1